MNERQKKLALIAGTIVIALILLLSSRKATGTTIVNQQQAPGITVSIPGMNIPVRTPFAVNIPGLPSFTPYQYSAVSPCMCNGSEISNSNAYNGPLVEFVTNQGNSGPNIYNSNTPTGVYTDRIVMVP